MLKGFGAVLLTLFIITGCTKRHLEDVTHVSALIIAVPMVPITQVYNLLNDTEGKEERKLEKWRQQFDPIYLQRIALIAIRDPKVDATVLYQQGATAFLPTVPLARVYPGLDYTLTQADNVFNDDIIGEYKLFRSLQLLLADDPYHLAEAGWKYSSDTYRCFLSYSSNYKVRFNRQMAMLSGLYEPTEQIIDLAPCAAVGTETVAASHNKPRNN